VDRVDRTVIIGIGNILQKDDGFGVHVIKELEKLELPKEIELVDGGTCTLALSGYFSDYPNVIIIDALKGNKEPGTMYKIKAEEIEKYTRENLSAHDVQILDVIKMVNMLGDYPDVMIYGIEPKEIKLSMEMSEIMLERVPDMVKLITQDMGLN
jgi:hydrogenase maturation protease